eukprot:Lithocolla_globosa_v1_NODE_58_length_7390_cov_243.140014.p4 type:complete len:160 gc:universal NODE_58_length_7390_cov_243.140014:2541-2062(-)
MSNRRRTREREEELSLLLEEQTKGYCELIVSGYSKSFWEIIDCHDEFDRLQELIVESGGALSPETVVKRNSSVLSELQHLVKTERSINSCIHELQTTGRTIDSFPVRFDTLSRMQFYFNNERKQVERFVTVPLVSTVSTNAHIRRREYLSQQKLNKNSS